MGNQLQLASTKAVVSPSDYHLHDLPNNVIFEDTLGSGRFFKTLKCLHEEGSIVVKVYFKRGEPLDVKKYDSQLINIKQVLSGLEQSHVWPFQRWLETDKAAYLQRQYFFSNLHERLSIRPFLDTLEKKWLAFQLIVAVYQGHSNSVCHGDIKCENAVVTSWNWLYLTDYAFMKPTYLPVDNPADFSFFFDTGSRRRCYLAPERFYDPRSNPNMKHDEPLKSSMDIFSLGCVIAELFLDGQSLFDLSLLLSYKNGKYDPKESLNKIADVEIRKMVSHMIQLNPSDRFSCGHYLHEWSPKIFPPFFFSSLHHFFAKMIDLNAHSRVECIKLEFPELIRLMVSKKEIQSQKSIHLPSFKPSRPTKNTKNNATKDMDGSQPTSKISPIEQKQICACACACACANDDSPLKILNAKEHSVLKLLPNEKSSITDIAPWFCENDTHLSTIALSSETKGKEERHDWMPLYMEKGMALGEDKREDGSGMVLIVALLCSCMRSVKLPQMRRICIDLLTAAAHHCSDDIKVQRVVPYIISLLADNDAGMENIAIVRACALYVLADVLLMVHSFPSTAADIFPEYIFPSLSLLPRCPEESVRVAYADNLWKFCSASLHFLAFSSSMSKLSQDGACQQSSKILAESSFVSDCQLASLWNQQPVHDSKLEILRSLVKQIVEELSMGLSRASSSVRIALLCHIQPLFSFMGRGLCMDFLLPLLITFLNDRDDHVRASFFHFIPSICTYLSETSIAAILWPCFDQSLNDMEESVITNTLMCLVSLSSKGLLSRRVLLQAGERASPLLCHPSSLVRRWAISFISSIGKLLSPIDAHALLKPMLLPLLIRSPPSISSEILLLNSIKPPVSRKLFDDLMRNAFLTIPPAMDQSIAESYQNKFNLSPLEVRKAFEKGKKPNSSVLDDSGLDGERLLAIDSYAKCSSSLMYTKMRKWEMEDSKVQAGASNTGYFAPYPPTAAGIPVYSIIIPSKQPAELSLSSKPSSDVQRNLDWERIFGIPFNFHTDFPNPQAFESAISDSEEMNRDRLLEHQNSRLLNQSILNSSRQLSFKGIQQPRVISTSDKQDLIPKPSPPHPRESNSNFHSKSETINPSASAPAQEFSFLTSLGMKQSGWHPKGVMLAHLQEHKTAVRHVSVFPNKTFLASASDDGSMKLWDCRRLESGSSFKSRHTFDCHESKVSGIAILDNRKLVLASATSLHLLDVSHPPSSSQSLDRRADVQSIFQLDQREEGQILALHPLSLNEISVLLYSTCKGGLHRWDSRTRKPSNVFPYDPMLGFLTNVVVDPSGYWAVSASIRGVLTLWDLRFCLPVNTWQHPIGGPIEALSLLHPGCDASTSMASASLSNIPHVYVAAGHDEVALWNAEDGSCLSVMRVIKDKINGMNDARSELPSALSLHSSSNAVRNKSLVISNPSAYFSINELDSPPPRLSGIRSLLPLAGGSALITAGSDCCIRLWNKQRLNNCYWICGPNLHSENFVKPQYESRVINGVPVIQEIQSSESNSSENLKSNLAMAALDGTGCHRDCILSLAHAHVNQKLLISSSRDGSIKVWK